MSERVCPIWVGYLLLGPVRKLMSNPNTILKPYVRAGMTVLEAGPAMGFFSLPLAGMVGAYGHLVCVDVQEKMIAALRKRAQNAGLESRMEFRICTPESLTIDDLAGTIDFAMAYYVVHEVPDARGFFSQLYKSLKPGGQVLFSEPVGHVTPDGFAGSISLARAVGFDIRDTPKIRRSLSALLAHP